MTDDLARSRRPTARTLLFRRPARLAPGDLRTIAVRRGGGVAAGMMTGALLGLAVLSAFTLPFARSGSEPAYAPVRAAVATPVAETRPSQPVPPQPVAAVDRPPDPPAGSATALVLEPLPTLNTDDLTLDPVGAAGGRPRQAPRRAALDRTTRCGPKPAAPCPTGATVAAKDR